MRSQTAAAAPYSSVQTYLESEGKQNELGSRHRSARRTANSAASERPLWSGGDDGRLPEALLRGGRDGGAPAPAPAPVRPLLLVRPPRGASAGRGGRAPPFHVIISTDCSPYSDWMSEALIYTHWASGTRGGITRISSCDDPGYKYPRIWHPRMTLQVGRCDRRHPPDTPSPQWPRPAPPICPP